MNIRVRTAILLAPALLLLPSPIFAEIQLVPVMSGLSSPVFVGHAGDGSNRLFVVEQEGLIKVLQPGAQAPTVFLDIRAKVLFGGERGLLGLAFHPNYQKNGRFFVYYTRQRDGDIVVAEHRISIDPNLAEPAEAVLLTIPHPIQANHNGGMLAFGPDGYLYIGVGDGGSGNDPPNNAQNIDVLLGKILRINVDQPDLGAGTAYSSPPDNPFVNRPGRDEIFAYGMRNPWRFSFDRATGRQWVGDVGQDQREEVDTPIVNGGNYGWRVYEGFACTNNDGSLCNPSDYVPPIFDYSHSSGRCSITGGYVYRGSLAALPDGTYVYGDYCSGEIFGWNGSAQSILLRTGTNISSFGEDEEGELYVVGLGGTVGRIASTPSCSYSVAPTNQLVSASAFTGTISVTAGASCGWRVVSTVPWIHVGAGVSGVGSGTVTYSIDANSALSPRTATMLVAGQTFTITQSASCTASIAPSQATFSKAASAGHVAVTVGEDCHWAAVSNAAWLSIASGTSGIGSGVVAYSVAPFLSFRRSRSGTLTVAGQTVSVVQSR